MIMNLRRGLFLLAWTTITPLNAADQTLQVDRVEVEDGDTLIVGIAGENQRLQLAFIDAPEDSDNAKLRHDVTRTGLEAETLLKLGKDATEHLRGLTEGNGPFQIRYDPGLRDRYGRIVAEVSDPAGRPLGAAMVADGFARVLEPRASAEPAPPPALTDLETGAREAGRGIWGAYSDQAKAWGGKL